MIKLQLMKPQSWKKLNHRKLNVNNPIKKTDRRKPAGPGTISHNDAPQCCMTDSRNMQENLVNPQMYVYKYMIHVYDICICMRTIPHCTILHCTMLYYTMLCFNIPLHYIMLNCSILLYIILYSIIPYHIISYCIISPYIMIYCGVYCVVYI